MNCRNNVCYIQIFRMIITLVGFGVELFGYMKAKYIDQE